MGIPEKEGARNPSTIIMDWTYNLIVSFWRNVVLGPLFFNLEISL